MFFFVVHNATMYASHDSVLRGICSFSTAFCQAIQDEDATPVEDWFGNATRPENGWAHAVSQNTSTADDVWYISRGTGKGILLVCRMASVESDGLLADGN